MASEKTHFVSGALEKLVKIEPSEIRATFIAFFLVFLLMTAYSILRPVRDAMASDWTNAEVRDLWTIQFFLSTFFVALYGVAVSHIRFSRLVPSVYGFFCCSFFLFYFVSGVVADADLVRKAFYLWVSLFSVFHISVFWSLMSDLFTKEQAGRLFGFIAAGASVGFLVGPILASELVDLVGTSSLTLLAAVLLIAPAFVAIYLQRLKVIDLHNESVSADLSAAKIGGNPFAGFKLFFSNPFLIGIGVFLMLYTFVGTFVYFETKNFLAAYEEATRIKILSRIDLAVNTLTLVVGMLATSRIVRRLGMPATLAMMPFGMFCCLLILAFAPILSVLIALQIFRRAGNYAITKPGREILFTSVDRETRFKAKPVIDIVCYRGGDMASSWLYTALSDQFAKIGLGLAALAVVGSGISAVWGTIGIFLGRHFNREQQSSETEA